MPAADFQLLPGDRILESNTSMSTEVCGVISGVTGIAIPINVTIEAVTTMGSSKIIGDYSWRESVRDIIIL